MNKKIQQINDMRENLLAEQGSLLALILADSKNPEMIGSVLCRVMDSAVRYQELTKAHADALDEATRGPAWLRKLID